MTQDEEDSIEMDRLMYRHKARVRRRTKVTNEGTNMS